MNMAQADLNAEKARAARALRAREAQEAAARAAAAKKAAVLRAHQIHERRLAAAKAAAAKAAAAKAAAKAEAAKSSSSSSSSGSSTSTVTAVSGSPEQIAQSMLSQFGWSSSQYSCLYPLWEHESGWSVSAYNAGSGAFGIPQALPGSKMASAGPDWQTDAATQIKWGLEYIQSTYGSPCGAWSHEEADGWY